MRSARWTCRTSRVRRLTRHRCIASEEPFAAQVGPERGRDGSAQEAEIRINTLRLVAIGLFYLVHLAHYYSGRAEDSWLGFLQLNDGVQVSEPMHRAVTTIVVAWTIWALLIYSLLRDHIFPRWLPILSICVDNILLTAVLVLSRGAASPLVAGYFLIIIMEP